MSSTKIKYYDAKHIAERVANKAFEHIAGPVEEALKNEGQRTYDAILIDAGLNHRNIHELESLSIIRKSSYCELVILTLDKDGDEFTKDITMLGTRDYNAPKTFVCHQLIVPKDMAEGLIAAHREVAPVAQARQEFENHIFNDIQGKTITTVLKKWPEIRGFVEDICGPQGGTDLVVPFADLIHKYMSPFMALPAPEAA